MLRTHTVVLAGLMGMAVFTVHAADYYVARTNSTPEHPYDTWATAATNIQDAVNAAAANATVWVAPGTYGVSTNAVDVSGINVVHINKALTLKSTGATPADTIIDGQGAYRGIYTYPGSGEQIMINGFTISNCWAVNGAGMAIRGGASRTVNAHNCVITK
ncbi:MAG: hypothetical protein LC725_11315, partial [Lentisphaerae bacterium]|nr:hypothetical protein [Lentisphaerota bacterium]